MKQELCNLDFCFWKTNCFKTFLNYNVGTITVKVRYQMNRKVSSKKKEHTMLHSDFDFFSLYIKIQSKIGEVKKKTQHILKWENLSTPIL